MSDYKPLRQQQQLLLERPSVIGGPIIVPENAVRISASSLSGVPAVVREPTLREKVDELFDKFIIGEIMRTQQDSVAAILDDLRIVRARNAANPMLANPEDREIEENEVINDVFERLEDVADHQEEVQAVLAAREVPDQPQADLAGIANLAINLHVRELGRIYENMLDEMAERQQNYAVVRSPRDEGIDTSDDEGEHEEVDDDDEEDVEERRRENVAHLEEVVDVDHVVAFHELAYQFAYGNINDNENQDEDPIE